ncbi:unnamed protein product [Lampetra fluviatilis]
MPPISNGFVPYMGPAGPKFPADPGLARRRWAQRPLNPSAPEFVPQPADAGGASGVETETAAGASENGATTH